MVQRVSTVAFEGIEARAVDVQVQVAPGTPAFAIAYRQCQNTVQRSVRSRAKRVPYARMGPFFDPVRCPGFKIRF